jgi:predicted MFS family arabinose efflux permease
VNVSPRDLNAPAGETFGFVLAVMVGSSVGALGIDIAPQMLAAIEDELRRGELSAGLAVSTELGAMAAASILFARRVARGSRARFALVGTVLVVVAQSVAGGVSAYAALLATRLVAGLGAGLLVAGAMAAAAGARDPERLFAQVTLVRVLFGAAVLTVLPWVRASYGLPAMFAALAMLALLAAPLLRSLPAPAHPASAAATGRAPNRGLAVPALAAVLLTALGQGAVWSFNEQLGLAIGLSSQQMGVVLGGTTLVGLAGAGLAAALGTRRGRTGPLVLGLLGIIASTVLLVQTQDLILFIAADAVWAFFCFFTLPYLSGLLAALDRQGQWSATGAGVSAIGVALGPAVGGALVAASSYGALTGIVLCGGFGALGLLIPVLRSLERGGGEAMAAPPTATVTPDARAAELRAPLTGRDG